MTRQSDWRRWAAMIAIHTSPQASVLTISGITHAIERAGWDVFDEHYDHREKMAAVRRVIEINLKRQHSNFIRIDGVPAMYGLSPLGSSFTQEHLLNNPNITPEKSKESNAYHRTSARRRA